MLDFSAVTNNDVVIDVGVTKKSDGLAFDLTGCAIKVQFFAEGSTTPLFTKSILAGTVVIDTDPSHFRFEINPADTVNFASGTYLWEAVITDADGQVTTLTQGCNGVDPGTALFRKELTVQGV